MGNEKFMYGGGENGAQSALVNGYLPIVALSIDRQFTFSLLIVVAEIPSGW
jgi:hypothetical protein